MCCASTVCSTFDEELVQRIERVEDITVGSEPEVEIRAVALHAVELLRHEVSSRRIR